MSDEIKINIEREKKILNYIKSKFQWVAYFFLAIIIWINIKIRIIPMQINPQTGKPGLWDLTRDNWTLGPDLDPFLFLRWAKEIVANGSLAAIDYMRYSPLGHSSLLETKVLPYTIAYFYKFLNLFSDKVTVEYAAVVLPVVMSVFMVIGFFLLVRKLFEFKGKEISNLIAVLASILLVTLPSLLARTIAGIPEKESMGFALMFFAFYFFLWAWKSNSLKKSIFLGAISGVFTALMASVSGISIFIFAVIAVSGFIALVFGKVGKSQLITYSSWIIFSTILWLPFTLRTTFRQFLTAPTTGFAVIVWVFILVYFLIFETKIKDSKVFQIKIIKKNKLISVLVISLIVFSLLAGIFVGPSSVIDFGKAGVSKLITPYSDRLSFTVAENRQPFFSDWRNSFGPIFKDIPLFFALFFIGSIFLFYEAIRKIKGRFVLVSSYVLFLTAIIFSRTSPNSILNGTNFISNFVYFSGYLILLFGIIYVFRKENDFTKIRFEYILVFSLTLVAIIAGRSGIRLIMLLAPIAVIPISYMTIISIDKAFKSKDELMKLLTILFAILLMVSVSYTIYYDYKVSESSAKGFIPSPYTHQWQNAMSWVRTATPQDAVFGSWWDYGYWIQTIGERATMLDGGNSISYWNYLMGRHVLTAESEEEALELLYNHNVTYFLIDSTDVGKYSAYSNIGSDENYDRFSFIGIFLVDNNQQTIVDNITTKIYFGGINLDEDLVINGTLFPRQQSGVGALIIPTSKGFLQPSAIIVYNGINYEFKLRYLFYNGELIDFGFGIEGAAFVFPSLVGPGGNINVDYTGAAMYLSPRNMRALWVRLYLLEEGENFHLAYNQPDQVVSELRRQGLNVSDIIYFGGLRGPIKIWEVEYTGKEEHNPEYLQRTYPDRIIDRRFQ